MEYGFQVADNDQRGLTGWNAWSQIHHNEVMIAAMGGGIAGGVGFFFAPVLTPIARLGRFGRVVTGGIEGMVSDVSATVVVSGVTRQPITIETLAGATISGFLGGSVGEGLGRWAF